MAILQNANVTPRYVRPSRAFANNIVERLTLKIGILIASKGFEALLLRPMHRFHQNMAIAVLYDIKCDVEFNGEMIIYLDTYDMEARYGRSIICR